MEIDFIQVLQIMLYFIIYSFCGWVLESIYKTIREKKWVNSGFLHGPLCPIYGVGAIIMILGTTQYKFNNALFIMLYIIFIMSVWEYFVGWLLEKMFNTKYWDYSKRRFNIRR